MNTPPHLTVGRALAHDSALKHAHGAALYIDDMPEPARLLHGCLVLSPRAHATLDAIDTTAALAVPGVAAICTARDIPGQNACGPIYSDEALLPTRELHYLGQPVALVLGTSFAAARAGARAVRLEVTDLPATLDVRAALAAQSYVCPPAEMRRGDAAAVLTAAPHRIRGEIELGGQDHFYLEGQVAMALPQEDGDMLVYSSTQHPTEVQHVVAGVLGRPHNAVTVELRRMGGGFGGKESQASHIAALAALGAACTRRPVKLRLERDDDMIVTGKRHPFLIRYDLGADDQGRILAADFLLAADGGWSADLSPAVVSRAMSHVDNAYYYPSVHVRGVACRTNRQSNTAFRGFGGPQGMMAAEAAMDALARQLSLDPLAVRRRNLYGAADGPRARTPYGQTVTHFRIPDMLNTLLDTADYAQRCEAVATFNAANPILKKGIAVSPVKFGISFNKPEMNQAGALVHVYTDGSIHLNHGGTEMGQGLNTKVAQVVAEVFSIDPSWVKITATSTGKVPNTSPTAASSGADLNGMAAHNAAMILKGRMAEVAATHFGASIETVIFNEGRVGHGNKSIGFADLAALCHTERVSLSATGYYRTPKIHFDIKTMTGHPFFYFAHGVAVSEVAIDTLTGEWRLLRADLLHDVGDSLNPAIDRGQIEGAFVQGMGWLTGEELVWDDAGRLLTHAPSTYKIPTARDVPADFRVEMLRGAPNPMATVFRSKAVGEPPLMLAISVWLALRDAIARSAGPGHVPTLGAPATPEKILRALREAQKSDG